MVDGKVEMEVVVKLVVGVLVKVDWLELEVLLEEVVCVLVAIDVGMSVGGGSAGNRGGAVMSGEEGSCESGGGAS